MTTRTLKHAGVRIALLAALALVPLLAINAAPDAPPAARGESDATRQASRWGFDYDALLARARKDPAHSGFIALATLPVLDAAGAEEYAHDLANLLRHHGDKRFAEALAPFTPDQQQAILSLIAYDFGIEDDTHPDTPKRKKAFATQYPKTAALMDRAFPAQPSGTGSIGTTTSRQDTPPVAAPAV